MTAPSIGSSPSVSSSNNEDPFWWYLEDGESKHTRRSCPALAQSDDPIPASTHYDVPGNRPLCILCRRDSGARPYQDQERFICEVVPLELEHIPDEESESFDARLVGDVVDDSIIVLSDLAAIPAPAPVEIKTCLRRIEDHGNGPGGRRGRLVFRGSQHSRLRSAGGYYLLAVIDEGRVATAALVDAANSELDDDLGRRWTDPGPSSHYSLEARIAWSSIIDPDEVEEAEK